MPAFAVLVLLFLLQAPLIFKSFHTFADSTRPGVSFVCYPFPIVVGNVSLRYQPLQLVFETTLWSASETLAFREFSIKDHLWKARWWHVSNVPDPA